MRMRERGNGAGLTMAAQEDNESHQEFPVASFPVTSRAELEERVVLALNSKDGQQSCVQDGNDPYTKAVQYVEKHRIIEIFQVGIHGYDKHTHTGLIFIARAYCSISYIVWSTDLIATCTQFLQQTITSRIAYEKPDDPLQFMLDEIEKVRKGQKLDSLK